MANKRKRHGSAFKAKVALEALKGQKTSHELAQAYSLQPDPNAQWKRELREHADDVFASPRAHQDRDREAELGQAYEQIGRLNMELAWLQKNRPNRVAPADA